MKGNIEEITYRQAVDSLLPRHYSGRTPVICKAFGWFYENDLKAVVTFGKPATPTLCKGIGGEEWSDKVYELNRLCRVDDWHEPLSQFVAFCLRKLKVLDWIIVSYSDTAMNHHGYIYQACNFIYTGATPRRTDVYTGSKHSRHYTKGKGEGMIRKIRSSKHRYVYFCTNNRHLKQYWMDVLRYPIEPYPKGDNENYKLGEYIKEKYTTGNLSETLTLSEWLDDILGGK